MLERRKIDSLLSRVISTLIETNNDKEIESLIDISWKMCRLADRDHYREPRIYMHTGHEDMTICVSSSIELLDKENLAGLFLHEIGHIIHHELPNMYLSLMDDDALEFVDGCDDHEIIAEFLIDELFGIHIYYDQNKVQWVSL